MTKNSSLYSLVLSSMIGSMVGLTSITAQAAVPDAFDVTGQWKVQKAAANSAPETPCMISNQYDNGFTMNLSGGQNQLLVMAVDFKQDIFDPSKGYETQIKTDKGFNATLTGKPFNASTLIYNLKSKDDAFDAFQGGQSLTLDVSDNTLSFSLNQLDQGLQAMNACAENNVLPTPPAIREAKAEQVDAQEVASIAPAAGTKDEEAGWNKDKPKEVYIKRQKKPMPSPLAWLKKSDSKEGALDATEQSLAALETAAGETAAVEEVQTPRPPEPIDLLNPDFKPEPVKAVQIDPPNEMAADPAPVRLQGGEPVLISRADDAMKKSRPESVTLFEKESEAAAQAIEQIQQPTRKVISSVDAPVSAKSEPVVRLAKAMPGKDSKEAYEPIRMKAYDPIVNTETPIDLAQEKVQQSAQQNPEKIAQVSPAAPAAEPISEPLSEPMNIKPLPGMKIEKSKPVGDAPANLPPKDELIAMLKAAEARIEESKKPDADAVLSAKQEAVIPIKTARGKDIFVSRPAIEEAQNKVTTKPQNIWQAKAGEDIKIVLARWAERADIDLVWEADRGGKIKQDINAEGDINAAVQMLLSQNAEGLGLEGEMLASNKVASQKPQILKASTPDTTRWNASSGASLRGLLQEWSKKEGIKLLWRSDRDYSLNRSVQMNGELETALTNVLGQYDSDSVRPVGQLNIDPVTNQKTLVIETERSL